jgi:hypothetical protein
VFLAPPTKVYSPECVEGGSPKFAGTEFSEARLQKYPPGRPKCNHLADALTLGITYSSARGRGPTTFPLRYARRFAVSPQITYKYLPPGVESTEYARSLVEPFDIRQVESVEEMMGATAGDLIEVYDLRNGGEERSFKVVSVGRRTYSGLVEESSMALGKLNLYVTDAE